MAGPATTVHIPPRQLALTLEHAESFAREDFLAGPPNQAALAQIDGQEHAGQVLHGKQKITPRPSRRRVPH